MKKDNKIMQILKNKKFYFISMKKLFAFCLLIFITLLFGVSELSAQNISINEDGAVPDPSAMLDVSDTTKGLLIPRMTLIQRVAIAAPAKGLIIYQIDNTEGFYVNMGTALSPSWQRLATSSVSISQVVDADGDTKIQVEEGTNEDIIRFDLGGSELFRMQSPGRINFSNQHVYLGNEAGASDNTNPHVYESNVGVGFNANRFNVGNSNVAVGAIALGQSTNASFNVAVGNKSMFGNMTGSSNTAIGQQAMFQNVSGGSNVAIGQSAFNSNTTGSRNVLVGNGVFLNDTSGNNNVAIGYQSGLTNFGSSNVFLGYQAAATQTELSNKLYIENSNSATPLIYGDFADDSLKIYGTLSIGDSITFPTNRGINGQVLTTDGNGSLNWTNGGGASSLWSASGSDIYYNSGGVGIGVNSLTGGYMQEIETSGTNGGGLLINNNINGNRLKTGIEINIDDGGNLQKYGTITRVIGKNNSADSLFGHYTEITPNRNSTSPPTFAYMAKFNGTDGDNWGIYIENEDYNYFSGNVGIGVQKPTALLEIDNAINPRKISLFTMADNDHQFLGLGTGFGELRYQVDQPTTDHVFYAGTSTTTSSELFRITGDGNVGMGTSTPVLNLVVTDSTANSVIGIHAANTSGDAYVSYISNGSAQYVSGYDQSSNTFKLAPNIANNSFTMSALGNIGMGTDSPSELLHISTSNGDAQILLEADTDNNAEADNPRLLFAQDGGVVSDFVGFEGTAGTFSASTISNALMMTTTSGQPLQFGTNSNMQMTILDGGNVGIGTETPGRKLNVSGTDYVTTLLESSSVSGTWLAFNNTSAGGKFHHILTTGSSNGAGPGKMHFGYGNSDNAVLGIAMTLADRLIGIGEDSPIGPLHVKTFGTFDVPLILEGDAEIAYLDANDFEIVQVDATGAITNRRFKISSTGIVTIDGGTTVTSDSTFKINVTPIPNVLESILKLDGVYHYWDTLNTTKGRFQSTRTLGLIAQKLQRVYPELVVENEDGYLSVDYSKFSAVLLQAIKEQQILIDQQNQNNEKQQYEIDALREEMKQLKELIKDDK